MTADIKEKYCKAKELSEFTGDPESNPFQSKYEARKLFVDIRDYFHQQREDDESPCILTKEAAIEYHLGVNYIYTEEVSAGQEKLNRVLELCNGDIEMKPEAVAAVIATCNELGLVWSTREEGIERAHNYLARAEELYDKYNCQCDVAPHTLHEHFTLEQTSEIERRKAFENLHTYTLFYLAQVYKSLGQAEKSAEYCMKTLRRQLDLQTYKPMEWALNCACLSQFFITRNMFAEGKHCLACANYIMNDVHGENPEIENKFSENRADVARCWVKYCLCVLEASKDKMENGNEASSDLAEDEIEKSFERFTLEVTSIEENVPDVLCTDYEQARKVFLLGKSYATKALDHFVLDGFVTDFVEINQDISRLYQHIACFEPELDLKCRMYKRRIDLITYVLNELNPQFYLSVCRQLQFELAETYSEMMDMKTSRYHSDAQYQTHHAKKKINSLCNLSMKYFNTFLQTFKSASGKFPERFEGNVERAGLLAYFYIARLYSKLITSSIEERLENLKMSYQYYEYVTSYADINEEATDCISVELELCREMVDVLPKTMDQIRTAIASS